MNSRILVGALILGVISASIISSSSAAVIGTGTVVGSGGLTSNVTWNDTFPGTATGIINGIIVRGRVLPVLNMTISGSGVIDL